MGERTRVAHTPMTPERAKFLKRQALKENTLAIRQEVNRKEAIRKQEMEEAKRVRENAERGALIWKIDPKAAERKKKRAQQLRAQLRASEELEKRRQAAKAEMKKFRIKV